ncbi:hypothetical protein C8F04DRAFT_1199722 [Mycena alexandri]|uniref:Uncharacterized protein n=1 Tax=Mycena alexandri TaxID=1745969 RepID=A0AAD6RYM3_9AGAR|nr:hypothetical protein C8F04DRAFT_1199722 [Mycena alexandri]
MPSCGAKGSWPGKDRRAFWNFGAFSNFFAGHGFLVQTYRYWGGDISSIIPGLQNGESTSRFDSKILLKPRTEERDGSSVSRASRLSSDDQHFRWVQEAQGDDVRSGRAKPSDGYSTHRKRRKVADKAQSYRELHIKDLDSEAFGTGAKIQPGPLSEDRVGREKKSHDQRRPSVHQKAKPWPAISTSALNPLNVVNKVQHSYFDPKASIQ